MGSGNDKDQLQKSWLTRIIAQAIKLGWHESSDKCHVEIESKHIAKNCS